MARFQPIADFLSKVANDWGPNLATLLAYNFLTALFPLVLGILALATYVLPDPLLRQLARQMSATLPTDVTGGKALNLDFYQMLRGFQQASHLTALISFLSFLWTGSNLFGVMENCFSIIFRTRGRDPVRQKLMAFCMVGCFAVLAPLAVLASTVSGTFGALADALARVPYVGLLVGFSGYVVGVVVAFALFCLIYRVVPNCALTLGEIWRGALVAAILFEIATYIFPFYAGHFMTHAWFGNALLFFGILAFWFWIISLVVVLGAELNSFVALGQGPLAIDLAGLVAGVAASAGRAPSQPPERSRSSVPSPETADRRTASPRA